MLHGRDFFNVAAVYRTSLAKDLLSKDEGARSYRCCTTVSFLQLLHDQDTTLFGFLAVFFFHLSVDIELEILLLSLSECQVQ